MHHLSSFERYNEELKVKQIIEYIDYSINESVDIKSIWNNVLEKIKGLSKSSKRRIIKYAIGSLLAFNTITNVVQIINNSKTDDETKQVAVEVVQESQFKNAKELTLSDEGWNHIKNEEKLKLKAYQIGDGMITVGYGHAERVGDSKYKLGQEISKEEAESLLKQDLKVAADGVRRMFRDWESQGVVVPVTQSMFDSLVSLAFNSGVSGLRNSKVADNLKKSEYKAAGDSIKEFRISKKFPGLVKRREKESEMFLASLGSINL